MEYKIKIILFEYYFKKIYLKTSWYIECIYIYKTKWIIHKIIFLLIKKIFFLSLRWHQFLTSFNIFFYFSNTIFLRFFENDGILKIKHFLFKKNERNEILYFHQVIFCLKNCSIIVYIYSQNFIKNKKIKK